MSRPKGIDPDHIKNATEALQAYLETFDAEAEGETWHQTLREARRRVASALRASNYLRDVAGALQANGGHMLVFRHLMAPPKSQDQFKLRAPLWSKNSENNRRPLDRHAALQTEAVFAEWRDDGVGRWLARNLPPSRSELRDTLARASVLIAQKEVETAQRNRLANAQERSVIELLEARGWSRMPGMQIDRRAALAAKHFAHKTRFATSGNTTQEVDIACGLGASFVLAMECKVTNDETNSVKRVNDVIKKANAWKLHWGSFVEPAALLQGVIKPGDVQRLSDGGVRVFWSHDLEDFADWLDQRVADNA
jgi:hypothetical protein